MNINEYIEYLELSGAVATATNQHIVWGTVYTNAPDCPCLNCELLRHWATDMWIENYGDAEWILTNDEGPLGYFATEEEALAYQRDLQQH